MNLFECILGDKDRAGLLLFTLINKSQKLVDG